MKKISYVLILRKSPLISLNILLLFFFSSINFLCLCSLSSPVGLNWGMDLEEKYSGIYKVSFQIQAQIQTFMINVINSQEC